MGLKHVRASVASFVHTVRPDDKERTLCGKVVTDKWVEYIQSTSDLSFPEECWPCRSIRMSSKYGN